MTLKGVFPGTQKPIALRIEGDRIAEVQTLPDRLPDQKDLPSGRDLPFLAPGFLDMQVNGAMITTSPKERILRNLRTLLGALAADRNLRSAIPGIHIEGPFISGLEQNYGTLEPGAPANLVLFRWGERQRNTPGQGPSVGGRLQILKTIRAGTVVYGD
jgi:N-acetylglucosamine-6-phosphate deacetylase